jgi:hypothetical protein
VRGRCQGQGKEKTEEPAEIAVSCCDHSDSLCREPCLLSEGFGLATFVDMNTVAIDLSPETYQRLEEQARKAGRAMDVLSRELLEAALKSSEGVRSQTTRDVLQAAGRAHPLSDTLRGKIIPGVTLDEVRTILLHAAGPSLSDIIQEQRGARL